MSARRNFPHPPRGSVRAGAIFFLLLPLAVPLPAQSAVIGWGRQVIPPPGEMTNLMDVSSGDAFNLGLRPGGTVVGWGNNNFRQATVPEDLVHATAIAAGGSHALALLRDGTLVAWGNDSEGQATVPEDLRDIAAISAGRDHSLALHTDGTVSAWGGNRYRQSEISTQLEGVAAISAGHFHNLALMSDGTVLGWGLNTYGQAFPPKDLTEVVAVAAGGSHSLALKRDGTVVAWGNDDFGQASLAEEIQGAVRIEAGEDHSLVQLRDGRVLAWGRNHYGQTLFPSGVNQARRIAAGAHHNVVLLEDGSLAAWGNNDAGQALNPKELASVVSVAAWEGHTVALKKDGTVFWWGTSVGAGIQPDPQKLRNVAAIAAGRAHGLALRANGTVVGWGDNLYGQASPPENLRNVVAIAAGEFHSIALRNDGTVAAWGNNFQRQVNVPRGLRKVIAIAAGQEHSVALRKGGMAFAWGNDFHGQRRIPAGLENGVSIATGSFHNLILGKNGTVTGWGSNLFGQTSVPAGLSGVVEVTGSRSHSVAIREDRSIIGWGGNHYGQTDAPPHLEQAVAVAAGGARTVVVTGELRPPEFVNRFESMSVPAGEDIFILPFTRGSRPLIYQWLKDGKPIEDANGPALSLPRVNALDSGSYSLILANPAGSSTSQTFSIEVEDPAVNVEAKPNVAVLNEQATFMAWVQGTGPFRYQWHKDGEPIRGATEWHFLLESVKEDDTGIYTIEVTNKFGTVSSEPLLFLVEPKIQVHPPAVTRARIGERLTLEIAANGSPPLEIQWLRDNIPIPEATEKTLVLENVRVNDGGVYRAVVSNPAARVASDETELRIIPHIVFQPEPQVFSSFQGTAVFEVRAIGTPPLTYHWMKDGKALARTPDPRLVLDRVQADDAGEYHVVVANPAGRVESERAQLIVPPAISQHPRSETIRAGENIEFSVRANGSRPLLFQWLKNGEPIPGEEGPQLKLNNVVGDDSARYSVMIVNEVGAITSQAGVLSISPQILTPPQPAVARAGRNVTLSVEAEGTRPLHYQWTRDGAVMPDARGASVTLENVKPEDAGSYSVIVSNSAGISVSEPALVEVN